MKDRIALLEFADSKYPNGIVVEIGVASGAFTKQILATYKSLSKIVIIDAWEHQQEGYIDSCNLGQGEQDGRYIQVLKDFEYEKRLTVLRMWSVKASELFDNNSIDFLYLDANHSYDACKEDLGAWYPKIKSGGVFAGHDYYVGDGVGHGVKKAVDEFALNNGLTVGATQNEYCRPEGVYGAGWEGISFYIQKP